MIKIPNNSEKRPPDHYRGLRRPVFSKTGIMMYESNDTLANRLWNLLERSILPPRSRDIFYNRFPAKQIWDALALIQVGIRPDFNFHQKMDCWKFYFQGNEIENLYATVFRTGAGWSMLALNLALDLAEGGDGEYEYHDSFWYPSTGYKWVRLDWRVPAEGLENTMHSLVRNPAHYHTHHPYYRLRYRRLKKMNIVILVRSVLESLESNFVKIGGSSRWPEIKVDNESSFPWDRHLDDLIEFYNSWGDYARHHSNCMIVRYHELKGDSLNGLKVISDFWNLDIPRDCLEEALSRTTKAAMKKKIPQEESLANRRVSFRKERGVLSESLCKHILERLQRELIHDFGYDYSDKHEWGRYYD